MACDDGEEGEGGKRRGTGGGRRGAGGGRGEKNPCPGHSSSLPCWIWIIFHTIVVHDSRVCHDLEPRSYLKGQGHSTHIPKICVRAITPYCRVGSG